MTTGVIMAAGRGSRMGRIGDELPKCLVPLNGRAVLTSIIELMQRYVDEIIVVAGWHADLVFEYVTHAHSQDKVRVITIENSRGPGDTLLASKPHVKGGLLYTSCDTLWDELDCIAPDGHSWVGVADQPYGTEPERWCRFELDDHDTVMAIRDKTTDPNTDRTFVYTGLGYIAPDDLADFWMGLSTDKSPGEVQVSAGLMFVSLQGRKINWLDVGDETAYRRAAALHDGYDWVKAGQITYVLPEQQRVVKYATDTTMIQQRARRGARLEGFVPSVIRTTPHMLSMPYIKGVTGYELAERRGASVTRMVLQHWQRQIWNESGLWSMNTEALDQFYRVKTLLRVSMLDDRCRKIAYDAVNHVNWDELYRHALGGPFHGDLNLGNVVISDGDRVYGIDWRENFHGDSLMGDLRYDLGKMYAGCIVHWGRARRGDFTYWNEGPQHIFEILQTCKRLHIDEKVVATIAALSLINSAPLHASPLDEIAVFRGVSLLEELRS